MLGTVLRPLQNLSLFKYLTRHVPSQPQNMSIYEHTVNNIDGEPTALSIFKGKVTLFVNVASQCGFTPQYEGLQKLQAKFAEQGFSVVAFPCNQFGGQEPEVCPRIKQFAKDKFHAEFPMMDKIDVNGEQQSPVYASIQSAIPGNIKWNFEKVLINKDGQVTGRFGSVVEPEALTEEIEKLLALPAASAEAPAASSSAAAL